ncbi:MAG: glycosyltransferase [Prevotella sp.]|uniref:glycosyltransferase n=1 Tax=Prevotella sp. TaxID=59823 RepID=UPI002A262B33|nr:glycosyltransferase [Prevotella sp.]MDD7317230.1 glycosyltransferase [Prevotellaceae bacterium]MDY4019834.1 glycosyltransferase [Prevotella sp.]
MKYSFVIPVFNRPDEVEELLESLTKQREKDFEVLIVEDGSSVPCEEVCAKYSDRLDLHYFNKPNSGPGQSRNYGAERARGEYLIILDSDVVVPESYLEEVEKELENAPADAFGGPDAAHHSFTPTQKAISYSMTSFFTTGGIRGGKRKLDKFYPRSFNMGVRRTEYLRLGGFSKMRFGEDIDFSIRIFKAGLRCRLFPEAWVWHKRRTDLRKFFRQVYNSGIARINLYKKYPGSLKIVHLLPMIFTVGVIALVLMSLSGMAMLNFNPGNSGAWIWVASLPWLPIILYSIIIFTDSTAKNRSLHVGLISVPAAFTQLMGYGFGFIKSWWKRCVMKQGEFQAFEKTFYK